MVAGVVLMVAITTVGVGLSAWVDVRLRFEERLAIGAVVGFVAVSIAGFLVFEAIGMHLATLLGALVLPGFGAVPGLVRRRGVLAAEAASAHRRLRLPTRAAASLRPVAGVAVVAAAISTRTLSLSYQTTDEGISAGSLAIWGDWAAHLAYAGSFAYGDNRALEQPLAVGHPLGYHFLGDFAGALLTPVMSLPQGLVWTAWLLAVALPVLMMSFVRRLTGSRFTAVLATVLFLLSGGLGAWYFLVDVHADGWDIVRSLPQTYARKPDQHLWVDNAISASLYAQRSTLVGVASGLAAGIWLLAARPRWSRSGFVAAGLLVGTTGISHVHLLATALALGLLALAFDRRSTWWWFLAPAALVGLPLAAAIRPPSNAMRAMVGWMAPQSGQAWPWFWFRNVGIVLPLFVLIAVLGWGSPRLRRLTAPLWLWFLVPNLIAFHPGEWNNTKFFLFWQFAAAIVIADLLRRAFFGPIRERGPTWRALAAAGAIVAVVLMTSAGALDALRATQRSTAIGWVDADEVAAATWLREHAEPGDHLVYGATNTSAVAALSGVPALTGYPGWTDDLGLEDWAVRLGASRSILSGAPDAVDQIDRYDIDWVVIGPRERAEMGASDAYWDAEGELAFEAGDYRIYRVPTP